MSEKEAETGRMVEGIPEKDKVTGKVGCPGKEEQKSIIGQEVRQ